MNFCFLTGLGKRVTSKMSEEVGEELSLESSVEIIRTAYISQQNFYTNLQLINALNFLERLIGNNQFRNPL